MTKEYYVLVGDDGRYGRYYGSVASDDTILYVEALVVFDSDEIARRYAAIISTPKKLNMSEAVKYAKDSGLGFMILRRGANEYRVIELDEPARHWKII